MADRGPDHLDTSEIQKLLRAAKALAKKSQHELVTIEHLMLVLTTEVKVQAILKNFNVDTNQLEEILIAHLDDEDINPRAFPGTVPAETELVHQLIQRSVAHVLFSNRSAATAVDVLVSIMQVENSLASITLHNMGMNLPDLKLFLAHGGTPAKSPAVTTGPDGEQRTRDITTKEEALEFLAKFTTNLNVVAAEGKIDSVIGRETEIEDLVHVIARRTKNNVVLVGEPGVGKTAIAEGLALKIIRKEVPEIIHNSEVFSMNIGDVIAGTRFRGDFEERIKFILKALTFVESPILFIDEIHMIMGAGTSKDGAMDVANLLKPALAKGVLRCIGSTTFEEYRKHFEKDRALIRRFAKLDIHEPDVESAKLIMRGLKEHYEKHHGVTYTDDALDQAVMLTHRFVQNQFLPDKAIDVIDRAGARQRVKGADSKVTEITGEMIQFEVSKMAKIPESSVGTDERAKLMGLEGDLKKAVFGQDHAVDTLVDAVMVARAGLREDNKPAGSFLFVGPTGVGKTETARQLASTLGVPLIKFDMSEYSEKHTVAKLIGSPPGYVGHGEGGAGSGLLTNEIEQNPHCVLLLDEFEKAHPDIQNTFLQVMDDGRLTNSNGKTVHFNNVTFIITSNAGAREAAQNTLGFSGPKTKEGADDAVIKKFFSPEFLNRLDAIVKFKSLGKDLLIHVVNKFLGRIEKQMSAKEISFTVSEAARNWLADREVDPAMGARPVERVVNEYVKKPLSKAIIFQNAQKGSTIAVDLVDDKITVTVL